MTRIENTIRVAFLQYNMWKFNNPLDFQPQNKASTDNNRRKGGSSKCRNKTHWSKPQTDTIKVNFDGSVTSIDSGRSGYVIRDHHGNVLSLDYERTHNDSVVFNEAFAALLGVRAVVGLSPQIGRASCRERV